MRVDLCEKCGADSEVRDSRSQTNYVRRRRQCKSCNFRWTTHESREKEAPNWRHVSDLLSRLVHIKAHITQLEESINALNPDT